MNVKSKLIGMVDKTVFCHVPEHFTGSKFITPVPLSRLINVVMTRLKDVALVQLALIPMVVINVVVKKVTNTQDQRKIMKRENLELGIQIINRLKIGVKRRN